MTVFALIEPKRFIVNLIVCSGVDTINATSAHLASRYTSYGSRFSKRLLDDEEREVLELIVRKNAWYVLPLFGILPGCLSQWVLGNCKVIGGLSGAGAAGACLLSYCLFTLSMSAASLGTGSVVMSSMSPAAKAVLAMGLALFAVSIRTTKCEAVAFACAAVSCAAHSPIPSRQFLVIFKSFDVWRGTTDEVRQLRRQRAQEGEVMQTEDERLLGVADGVELELEVLEVL